MTTSVILQVGLGAPELVIILMILLPLIVLTAIGVVLIKRLMNLPEPSKVNELEREVVDLREQVEALEAASDTGNDGREDED
jgi:hypothetical protein